jgi:hypothetical protein
MNVHILPSDDEGSRSRQSRSASANYFEYAVPPTLIEHTGTNHETNLHDAQNPSSGDNIIPHKRVITRESDIPTDESTDNEISSSSANATFLASIQATKVNNGYIGGETLHYDVFTTSDREGSLWQCSDDTEKTPVGIFQLV